MKTTLPFLLDHFPNGNIEGGIHINIAGWAGSFRSGLMYDIIQDLVRNNPNLAQESKSIVVADAENSVETMAKFVTRKRHPTEEDAKVLRDAGLNLISLNVYDVTAWKHIVKEFSQNDNKISVLAIDGIWNGHALIGDGKERALKVLTLYESLEELTKWCQENKVLLITTLEIHKYMPDMDKIKRAFTYDDYLDSIAAGYYKGGNMLTNLMDISLFTYVHREVEPMTLSVLSIDRKRHRQVIMSTRMPIRLPE